MKKICRYLSFSILVILLFNTNLMTVKASGNPNDAMFESVMEAIELEKSIQAENLDNVQYSVFNFNGQDITTNFKNIAYPLYLSKDYHSLQQYCSNNVKKIVITTEVLNTAMRSDLSKTVDHKVTETMKDLNGKDLSCTVKYTVRGSITYDPNTYQISSASKPVIVDRIITPTSTAYSVKTRNEIGSSNIAPNKLSANFSYQFDVYMTSEYVNIEFGVTSCSFTISPT